MFQKPNIDGRILFEASWSLKIVKYVYFEETVQSKDVNHCILTTEMGNKIFTYLENVFHTLRDLK